MSSVRSLFASSTIAAAERRLRALGRIADDNSSAAFAVKPAGAAQDPEPDAPPPSDPVIIAVDVTRPAAAIEAAQAASQDVDAENETIPPVPKTFDVAMTSQAAQAYAQTMRAWLDSKSPRPVPARRPAKPNADTER